VYKYFSCARKVFLNTFQVSPAPERYQISVYIEILLRRRRSLGSIQKHFSGAGEVLIYTYLAPERPEKLEKSEKYLYVPPQWFWSCINVKIRLFE